MSELPLDACPTAITLFAYSHGQLRREDPAYGETVAEHIRGCRACQRALAGFEEVSEESSEYANADLHVPASMRETVESQRAALAAAVASVNDKPHPGDVWVTRWPGPDSLLWMCLVADTYWREYSREWVLDLYPVTEDPELAADWSYIVPEDESDIRTPLVVHVDFQFAAQRSGMVRRVGRVAEACVEELRATYSALLSGDVRPELQKGRLGAESVRGMEDWFALSEDMYALQRAAAVSVDREADCAEAGASVKPALSAVGEVVPASEPFALSPRFSFVPAHRESPTTPFSPRGGPTGPPGAEQGGAGLHLLAASAPHIETGRGPDRLETLGAVLEFYFEEHEIGLHDWFSRRGISEPPDVAFLSEILFSAELEPTGLAIHRHIKRHQGGTVDRLLLTLITEAVVFQRTRLHPRESIDRRAARLQDPFREGSA